MLRCSQTELSIETATMLNVGKITKNQLNIEIISCFEITIFSQVPISRAHQERAPLL